MTTADYLRQIVIPAAFALLPPEMASPEATALLMAIALQESGCTARRQVGGPARGYWQFEVNGVRAVMAHPACYKPMNAATDALGYTYDSTDLYVALEHNDVLAAIFARLLIWSDPHALPPATDPDAGWKVYVAAWRPGTPRPADWPANFAHGWQAVTV